MTPDERKQKIIDYQKAFLSAEGANVLADLSRVCFEHRRYFFGDSERMSWFTEWIREVLLYVKALVSANPDEEKPTEALTEEKNHV